MDDTEGKFEDLAMLVDEAELTGIVKEVDHLYRTPERARGVAQGIIALRDGEDEADRQLAIASIRDYFAVWLRHRGTKDELVQRVDSA